ncbi:MAG: glycoside hydrolase family 9 protein [Polyangiaceae bacterium]|nr:glycoside hydrolase family 9 protein [Polyangiaceae bacterium]
MAFRTSLRSSLFASALSLGLGFGCGTEEARVISSCPPGSRDTGYGCAYDQRVAVNSVGYLPDRVKRATVPVQVDSFQVRDAAGGIVYEAAAIGPTMDQDEQTLWVLDFTEVRQPGEYYVSVQGPTPYLDSVHFEIGEDVYDSLLHILMLGMTGQRCGSAVGFTWNGTRYSHPACHLDDASLELVEGAPGTRDGTGGWHDAGDYGKYTVNGAFASGMMLLAWEHFPERLVGRAFDLPEAGDEVPDYLDENRVNLDWLLKMQNADGSVVHKLTALDFPGFVSPVGDYAERYFSDWSSAGTADFVAVMAQAARVYEPVDPEFAAVCLAAARRSFDFLKDHPEEHSPVVLPFKQMQYVTSDPDDRAWGACELWETTGDEDALVECEVGIAGQHPATSWDWSGLGSLAVYTYVLSRRSDRDRRDPELVLERASEITSVADTMALVANENPWGLASRGNRYWGINGVYARMVLGLRAAYMLEPKPEYLDAATQQIDHLLGRNYSSRSQVTGIGYAPPAHPHHRPSAADGIDLPWPGLLIGGAWPDPWSWTDVVDDAKTGENAINWNAALIYAVAGFVR